jgi:hypothetical protein
MKPQRAIRLFAPRDLRARRRAFRPDRGPDRLRRSLATAGAEGAIGEVVPAFTGGAVLTAWALHLGCGPAALGLLAALPHVLQALHVPAAWATSRLGARRVARVSWLAARQLHLALAAIPWLGASVPTQRVLLLSVAGASAGLGIAGSNAWLVWMTDLVHPRLRGRFFGGRAARGALVGAAAGGVASVALDRFPAGTPRGAALSALAIGAWVAGALSSWLMRRLPEPRPRRGAHASRERPREAGDGATRRRALTFVCAWSGALGVSSSFVPLHMLSNLGFGFSSLALHAAGVAVGHLAAARAWSRRLDARGPSGVLRVATLPAALVPLVWLLPARSAVWAVALDAALTGVLLSGQSLALVTLPMTTAPQDARARHLAKFSTAGGLSFAATALASGVAVQRLPAALALVGARLLPLQGLFAAGTIARLAAAALGWVLLGRRRGVEAA